LGYGDVANRGDSSNEMGDYLPPVDLGSGFIPTHECGIEVPTSTPTFSPTFSFNPTVTFSPSFIPTPCAHEYGGEWFICIVTTEKQVKCWGKAEKGYVLNHFLLIN